MHYIEVLKKGKREKQIVDIYLHDDFSCFFFRLSKWFCVLFWIALHGECMIEWGEAIVFSSIIKIYVLVTLFFSSAFLCAEFVEIGFNNAIFVSWEQKPFSLSYCCCWYFAVTPDVQITIYDSHSIRFVYISNASHFGLWSTICFGSTFIRTQYVYTWCHSDRLIDPLHKSIINKIYWISFWIILINTLNTPFSPFKSNVCKWHTMRSKCGYCHSKEESDTYERHFLLIDRGEKCDLLFLS